jgi:peroxiredoxin
MPTLKNEINRFKEKFDENVPVDVREILNDATSKLIKLDIKKNSLKVGEHIPEFTLLNASNKAISINEQLRKNNYIILNFYRGSWCPYCNFELNKLQKNMSQFKILHTSLIAISAQTPDNSLELKEKNSLTFEVLCDKNNAIARKFGLVFTLEDRLIPIYEDFGIDILESNKNGTYDLPIPATYVINKNFEIIFTFVDEDYTNRCEPEDILQAIKKDIKNSH